MPEIKKSLVATGFAHNIKQKIEKLQYFKEVLIASQAVRRAGSAALDLCYVACGRFDAFWEFDLKPWDTSAGVLLITEAGGKITNLKNTKYDIFQSDIVATNGLVHSELVDILETAENVRNQKSS